MKGLKDLLAYVRIESSLGDLERQVHAITADSRKVMESSLFVATRGTQVDGHAFIETAIEKGAKSIVCEHLPENLKEGITYIVVQNAAIALGWLASAFYNYPSQQLKLVAITGTNGKTTNATLLYQLFRKLGYETGLISTVHNRIVDEVIPATHTTPDPVALQQLLAQMVARNCTHCFMEASSHAIDQDRLAGLSLVGAVFTNITHDHLDYHITFDNYIKAKKKLFDQLPSSAFALTNVDDKRGEVMVQNTAASVHTFALKNIAEFKGKVLHNGLSGLEMEIDKQQVWFRLIGLFNAYNLLGAYAVGVLLGEESGKVLTGLSSVKGAAGRFETLLSDDGVIGIVDYAHTPDALENVLETIAQLRTHNETVRVVLGCGGNRDTSKRPIMAAIACKFANEVIFTADNPRNEDPEVILDAMMAGVPPLHFKKAKRITDRKQAIISAVKASQHGDIILVAGKGHEDYQEIKGVKYPFDDRIELEKAYNLI